METELINLIVLFIVLITIIVIGMVMIYKKYIHNLIQKERNLQQMQIKHKEQLLAHVIDAEERERQSIAEDLHDNLTARLNILKLQLYEQNMPSTGNKIFADLDTCITISRNISHQLKSPILNKFGLLLALKDLLDSFHQTYTIDFYELTNNGRRLTAPQELHLYRIAQEVLVNIIKHSKAKSIEVLWRNTPKLFVLILRDDGVGINSSQEKGIGMSNILARVDYLKAEYRIRTAPHKGTSITIAIRK